MLPKLAAGALSSVLFFGACTTSPLIAETTTCQQDIFKAIPTVDSSGFDYPTNIAKQTVPRTLGAAAVVLMATQVVKHYLFPDSPIVSWDLAMTLPLDTLLTVMSHGLGLEKIPYQAKFGRYADVAKVAVMSAAGTASVVLNWALFSVAITPAKVCVAGAYCSFVYYNYFPFKHWLFKVLPIKRDLDQSQALAEAHSEKYAALQAAVREHGAKLAVGPKQIEDRMLSFLDGMILSYPYEDLMEKDSYFATNQEVVEQIEELQNLRKQINELEPTVRTEDPELKDSKAKRATVKLTKKLLKLRRSLVTNLIAFYDENEDRPDVRAKAAAILQFSNDPNKIDFDLQVHRVLDERAKTYTGKVWASSFADQFVGVAMAGGVGLFAVNAWARTGELPLFVQALISYAQAMI